MIISTLVMNLTNDTWVSREHMAAARSMFNVPLLGNNIIPYAQISTYLYSHFHRKNENTPFMCCNKMLKWNKNKKYELKIIL